MPVAPDSCSCSTRRCTSSTVSRCPDAEPDDGTMGAVGAVFDDRGPAPRRSCAGELDVSDQRYEVMYFLDLADERIDDFKQGWGGDRRLDRRRRRRRPLELPRPHQRHRRGDRGRRSISAADPSRSASPTCSRRSTRSTPSAKRDAGGDAHAGHARSTERACPAVTTAVVAVCSGDGLVELFAPTRGPGCRHRRADDESVDRRTARHGRARQRRPGRDPAEQQEHHPGRRAGRCAHARSRSSSCRPARCPRRWPRSSSTTPRPAARPIGVEMVEAADSVATGEVTQAVRDTNSDRRPGRGGRLDRPRTWRRHRGDRRFATSGRRCSLLDHIVTDDAELVTVVTGAEATPERHRGDRGVAQR